MATRTITTTAAEDEAIAFAHLQTQRAPAGMAVPPPGGPAPPPIVVETEAQFFERMTRAQTITPMVAAHTAEQNQNLVASLASVPPENRAAAQTQIEAVITGQGGTVTRESVEYLYSSNTAPPPRNNSFEVDATAANFAQVTKITFDDLDRGGVSRMATLLALPINTTIRIEALANAANMLQVVTTAAPIQRQGADGHVEIAVRFNATSGSFAGLDTTPMRCAFV